MLGKHVSDAVTEIRNSHGLACRLRFELKVIIILRCMSIGLVLIAVYKKYKKISRN